METRHSRPELVTAIGDQYSVANGRWHTDQTPRKSLLAILKESGFCHVLSQNGGIPANGY